MSAPNIVGVTTITGITTFLSLSSTNPTLLVSNPASSNEVYKINSIIVANDSDAATGKVTIKYHDAAAGLGVSYSISKNVGVASEATLVVLDRAAAIYLEEGRSISAQASNANYLDVICSYESIID